MVEDNTKELKDDLKTEKFLESIKEVVGTNKSIFIDFLDKYLKTPFPNHTST